MSARSGRSLLESLRAESPTIGYSVLAVQFEYATGVGHSPLTAATLVGSWDDAGQPSPGSWSARPMRRGSAADGSDAFFAEVEFDEACVDGDFAWGVLRATPQTATSPSASLLPGLLAATRTGLTPAGGDELMLDQLLDKHLQLWAHSREVV